MRVRGSRGPAFARQGRFAKGAASLDAMHLGHDHPKVATASEPASARYVVAQCRVEYLTGDPQQSKGRVRRTERLRGAHIRANFGGNPSPLEKMRQTSIGL